jgi:hypothetical protein
MGAGEVLGFFFKSYQAFSSFTSVLQLCSLNYQSICYFPSFYLFYEESHHFIPNCTEFGLIV